MNMGVAAAHPVCKVCGTSIGEGAPHARHAKGCICEACFLGALGHAPAWDTDAAYVSLAEALAAAPGARELGIEQVIAEVLPGNKAKVVQDLQRQGRSLVMVGDGVNDTPALAVADIGIAIGSGSDVAKEIGGIILIKNDVRDVVLAIRLSRATMAKIKQNLFWAFIYNMVGIPVAALGFLSPIIATAAMALSSLSVIVNSALLKRTPLAGGT